MYPFSQGTPLCHRWKPRQIKEIEGLGCSERRISPAIPDGGRYPGQRNGSGKNSEGVCKVYCHEGDRVRRRQVGVERRGRRHEWRRAYGDRQQERKYRKR